VSPAGVLGPVMPDAVRHYWSGTARLHAGDRPGARERLGEAARRSGRNQRVRELAEVRLAAVDMPGIAGPHAYPSAVAELADRLARLATAADASEPASHLLAMTRRPVPLTLGLIAINIAVTGVAWAIDGATDSMATLVRAGNLYAGVAVGEWWRLPTSVFVHVGIAHLFLNMYGLWVLGRFVEQLFGSARTFALYMVAGTVGAAASHLFSGAPVSAGASGAVLGLAGALLAELGLHRGDYPRRWRTGLFRVLAVLTAANIAIGFAYPAIDQGAHLGGLIAGALMALWLSPRPAWSRAPLLRAAATVIATAAVFALGYGAFAASTTSFADTLAKYPAHRFEMGRVTVDAPGLFVPQPDGGIADDSGLLIRFELQSVRREISVEAAIDTVFERERKAVADQLMPFDAVAPSTAERVVLPEPWQSREFSAIVRGPGSDRAFRVIAFGRVSPDGDALWVGAAYMPDELAVAMRPVLARILGSAQPTAPAFR
jgi:membrane associated rhomboid family serine protease